MIIINNSSMIPIYEQIVNQVKQNIVDGKLKEGDALPSVRGLSKDLKISALTVKKAYDILEADGSCRKWYLFAGSVVVCVALVVCYLKIAKPVYEVSADILVFSSAQNFHSVSSCLCVISVTQTSCVCLSDSLD